MRIQLENNPVLTAMPDPEEALELHSPGQWLNMLTPKAILIYAYPKSNSLFCLLV